MSSNYRRFTYLAENHTSTIWKQICPYKMVFQICATTILLEDLLEVDDSEESVLSLENGNIKSEQCLPQVFKNKFVPGKWLQEEDNEGISEKELKKVWTHQLQKIYLP